MLAVFQPGGVIRMAGPGRIPQGGVIPPPCVAVSNQGAQGRAAGTALLVQAGYNLRRVRLPADGGKRVLPRGAPLHKGGDFRPIRPHACRKPLDHRADVRGVGLAEQRDAQPIAQLIIRHGKIRPPKR